jgi:hypothetical protein
MVYKGLGEIYYIPPFQNGINIFLFTTKKAMKHAAIGLIFNTYLQALKKKKMIYQYVTINPNPAEHFIKINNPKTKLFN